MEHLDVNNKRQIEPPNENKQTKVVYFQDANCNDFSHQSPVAYLTKEVNPSFAKLPSKFDGSWANILSKMDNITYRTP